MNSHLPDGLHIATAESNRCLFSPGPWSPCLTRQIHFRVLAPPAGSNRASGTISHCPTEKVSSKCFIHRATAVSVGYELRSLTRRWKSLGDTLASSSEQLTDGLNHIIIAFVQGMCWSDVQQEGSGLKCFTWAGRGWEAAHPFLHYSSS